MDLSRLNWLKNIRDADHEKWAYNDCSDMAIPEAKILQLHWRTIDYKENAQLPPKGDLMVLIQKAKVTHIVEFLDNEVYENKSNKEWNVYRIVQAVWMPPKGYDWESLPHQKEVFALEHNIVYDGKAHSLADTNKMYQFHQYWDLKGGLPAFQQHLQDILTLKGLI